VQPLGSFLLLPNELRYSILYLAAKQKRDYRVAALVIPTPTPEWPFDGPLVLWPRDKGLRTVPRSEAWAYDSTKPLPGQVGGGLFCL